MAAPVVILPAKNLQGLSKGSPEPSKKLASRPKRLGSHETSSGLYFYFFFYFLLLISR